MQSDALTLLNAILPGEGWYCGWRKDTKQHFWTENLEELAEWCLTIGRHTDVYHACCSFKTNSRRTKDNAHQIKALRLDVDAGPGKPYQSGEAALQALGRFCAEHSLPRPWVVGSGGGLHVYYPLAGDVDAAEFVLLANQLRNKCHDGLFIDEGCTLDPVRILRTPGTFNYKDAANPRPVRLLCTGGVYTPERLGLSPAAPVPPRRASSAAGGQTLTERLAAPDDTPDADAELIADQCFAMEAVAADPSVDNPLWFAACTLLARCHNGLEKAREWSAEHRQGRIEGVFERSEGPATCAHLETVAGLCEGCRHRGRITSPIQLGRVKTAAPAPFVPPQGGPPPWGEAPVPENYAVNEAGNLVWLEEGKQGGTIERIISPFPVYLTSENEGEQHDTSQALVLRAWSPHDGFKEIEIGAEALFSHQGMAKLEGKGVIVLDRDKMFNYLRAARIMVKQSRKMDTRYEQFGWKYGNKAFALGRRLLRPDGEQPIIGTDDFNKRARAFVPKGSKEVWQDAVANFAGAGKEAHAYMAVAPFAAPLMQFRCGVGEGGVILHGWSPQTGAGKSTSMFGGMAGIGDPALLKIKSNDTVHSRADLLALLHTLPVCFDEVDKLDPEELHSAVMQFTQGEDRVRLSNTGVRTQRNGRWATIMLMTANFSLMNALAARKGSIAQMHRVVELRFPDDNPPSSAKLYKTFEDHYGWGAAEFFPYIVRPDVNQWIREHELPRVEEKLRKDYGLGASADRFHLAAHTCVWVAIEICKTLGLIRLTPQRIIEAALKNRDTLKSIQGERPTMLDLLGRLMDGHNGTVVNVAHALKPGVKQQPQHTHFPRLFGRHEADTRTLYFSWARVQEFLRDEGVATYEFYKTLLRLGVIKTEAPRRMDITRDVRDLAPHPINVVQFDMGHPLITGQPRLVETDRPEERSDARLGLR